MLAPTRLLLCFGHPFMLAFSFFLNLLLAAAPQAQEKHPSAVIRGMKKEDLIAMAHHVPQEDQTRLAQLKQTFTDAKCEGDSLHEQTVGAVKNLQCTLAGDTPETILFVAHYEHAGPGMSAVEDWSGAIMLPFLYYAMTASPRHRTYVFLEADGAAGARAYVRSLTHDQLHAIKAVVAVDALGLGPLSSYQRPNDYLPSPWERQLQAKLTAGALERGLTAPPQEIPGAWLKVDDTQQFRYHGIATILVHSVSHAVHDLPGGERDNLDAIHGDAYFDDYAALCFFMIQLDELKMTGPDVDQSRTPSRGRR
jgi:hypothetical protein